jgi:hypothetical protein
MPGKSAVAVRVPDVYVIVQVVVVPGVLRSVKPDFTALV